MRERGRLQGLACFVAPRRRAHVRDKPRSECQRRTLQVPTIASSDDTAASSVHGSQQEEGSSNCSCASVLRRQNTAARCRRWLCIVSGALERCGQYLLSHDEEWGRV